MKKWQTLHIFHNSCVDLFKIIIVSNQTPEKRSFQWPMHLSANMLLY